MPFQAGSWDHWAALGVILGACLSAVWLGRRRRGLEPWLRRVIALGLVGYLVVVVGLRTSQVGWRWGELLPLHLCDLVVVLAVDALLRGRRLACELTYYWAMAGTAQALITPDLHQGFPSWHYFLFFWGHGTIILAVAVLLGASGFRPSLRGIGYAFAGLLAYVAVVGGIDWLCGWNYGYLCYPPSQASLVDWLGPWPHYVVAGLGVALGLFWALYLPWVGSHKYHKDNTIKTIP